MQTVWKAGFLLLLLFHRDCATTIHGGSNDVPAHNIEERSLEPSETPKNTTLLELFGTALALGRVLIKQLPPHADDSKKSTSTMNAREPPSWTKIVDGFTNSILLEALGNVLTKKLQQFGGASKNRTSSRGERGTKNNPPSWPEIVDGITNSIMSQVSKFVLMGKETCYNSTGCFRTNENMSLPYGGPVSPAKVGTVFYFFHNNSRNDTHPLVSRIWTLDNWTIEEMNDSSKPLMIVTHGFTGDINTPWLIPLVDALLLNVNCNVIVADWRNGSAGPNYARAAANTPMAGVQISQLLIKIIKATNCTLHPDNVTLIGFSLGAHVVGFAGRHFHRNTSMLLGRITGLDPAGMLFEDTNASLSRHDAKFVDVMHTNMGDIKTLQLGLRGAQGHVDFYPNGGHYQPGCRKHPNISIFPLPADLSTITLPNLNSSNKVLLFVMESVACSHYRAPDMFTESLTNHNCNFTSYPCPGGWKNFTECKKKFEKNETVTGLMGYYSYTAKGRGKQYLQTNGKPPYCNNTVSGETAVC